MGRKPAKANIIFDLDGTLADSIDVVIDVLNDLKVIDRTITRDDYELAKNMTIKDIAKELGISLWRAPRVLVKGRAELTKRIDEIPFFAGMDQTIDELSKENRLFVMSSNSLVNVEKFLKIHGIDGYFEKKYGGIGIFSKAKMLKKIIKDYNLDSETSYYIGDEIRDVDAAKKAGIKSVSVTWGFNGEEILSSRNPDHIVRTPQELASIFRAK